MINMRVAVQPPRWNLLSTRNTPPAASDKLAPQLTNLTTLVVAPAAMKSSS